jgi:predicted PurR-regulated permease PerM
MGSAERDGRAGAGRRGSPGEVATAIRATAAAGFALLLFWIAADVFLLVFAGLLLGMFLTHTARLTARRLRLPYAWSLAAVLLGLAAAIGTVGWLMLPRIAFQLDELMARLPAAVESLRRQVQTYEWGQAALARMEVERLLPSRSDILARITGVASSTLGGIANLFVILFVGVYGATEPRTYGDGFVRLIRPAKRDRARQILDELYRTLGWWLLGRLCSMVVVGVATGLGLWLLGVPLALTLGLIAAVLGFVPYVGPIVAAVPAVLIALTQGPQQAFNVLLFYAGLQTLESYLLTPLVQRRAVALAPALQIAMQVLAGVLFGVVGLALATPLTAAGQVIVRMAYVEDVLGDRDRPRDVSEKRLN